MRQVRDRTRARLFGAALSIAAAAAAAAVGTPDSGTARLAAATERCTYLHELVACGDALNIKPNDPGLLIAEADTLVQLRRPGEAIGVYRNALSVAADPLQVGPRIERAQTLRLAQLAICLDGPSDKGQSAETACQSAWLPGAPDEVSVFKRRAALLRNAGRTSEALDAYRAAARLRPRDGRVALAIAQLTRGSALVTAVRRQPAANPRASKAGFSNDAEASRSN